jgi:hypothetical protein
MKLEISSTDFRKTLKISTFVKIRPARSEFFHADGMIDGRTDRDDDTSGRFSQFCERV